MGGEQPGVHGQHAAHHGHDDRRPEQRPQEHTDGVRGDVGQQGPPRSEREQRVGSRQRSRGARGGDDAEGQQLRGDEMAYLVAAQRQAEVLTDQVRDGARVARAVDPAGHLVQQPGHLDDLTIGPSHERRRLGVAGALVLAEQFDPIGQPRRRHGSGRTRRGRDGFGALGSGLPCGCGHGSAPPSRAHQGNLASGGSPARYAAEGPPECPGDPSFLLLCIPLYRTAGQACCEPDRATGCRGRRCRRRSRCRCQARPRQRRCRSQWGRC